MKRIIVFPDGTTRKEFESSDLFEFHLWLFAVLSGQPKCVEICFDKDNNIIYDVSYL